MKLAPLGSKKKGSIRHNFISNIQSFDNRILVFAFRGAPHSPHCEYIRVVCGKENYLLISQILIRRRGDDGRLLCALPSSPVASGGETSRQDAGPAVGGGTHGGGRMAALRADAMALSPAGTQRVQDHQHVNAFLEDGA